MKKILNFRIHPALGILIVVAAAGIMPAILYSETLNLQLAAGRIYQEDVASGESPYLFVLAGTPAERSRGLSGADSLPANTVMLFSYEGNDTCGVWMKDMKFPIDIVWLDENFNVIYFTESLSPATYPRIFYPVSLCRYFIEAEEGLIRTNDISIGSRVSVDFANSLIHF
jgi:uncharacterized membrane protein (UPF0127 family)